MLNRKEKLAYLAGIFDGEGCVGVSKTIIKKTNTFYHFLEVRIVNTDYAMMKWIVENFGGHLIKSIRAPNRRNCYIWRIMKSDLMEELLPYLITKKKQIEQAILFTNTKGRMGRRITNSELKQRDRIMKRIKFLNNCTKPRTSKPNEKKGE